MTSDDRRSLQRLENLQEKLIGVMTCLKKHGCLSKEYEAQFRDFLVSLIKNFVTGRLVE